MFKQRDAFHRMAWGVKELTGNRNMAFDGTWNDE